MNHSNPGIVIPAERVMLLDSVRSSELVLSTAVSVDSHISGHLSDESAHTLSPKHKSA
jgi:hypothetical protein